MPHVFVETNWLFAYAAPAHHQIPAAAGLLERARTGEFTLHMPYLCIDEARQAIRTKCQPRSEANALRRFLTHAIGVGSVTEADATIGRTILNQYESSIKNDLDNLDNTLQAIAALPHLHTFALDQEMLARCTQLALEGIAKDPFDQAILAGIIVSAEHLWTAGERGLSLCELDNHLHPGTNTATPRPTSQRSTTAPTFGCTGTSPFHSPQDDQTSPNRTSTRPLAVARRGEMPGFTNCYLP